MSSVPWYKERLLQKISLGSLLMIVLLRTAHYNLAKLKASSRVQFAVVCQPECCNTLWVPASAFQLPGVHSASSLNVLQRCIAGLVLQTSSVA